MAHAKEQIRAAVKARLVSMTTIADADVHDNRVYPFPKATAPTADITTPEEQRAAEAPFLSHAQIRHAIVRIVVRAKVGVDDSPTLIQTLDNAAVEIESKICTKPPTLGGLVDWIEWQSTTVETSGEIEKPSGEMVMDFRAAFIVSADDPSTILTAP